MTRSRQFELVRAEPKEERGMAAIGATLSSERLLAKDSNSPKPPVNVVTREPAKASLITHSRLRPLKSRL
jgi:hypothetical protein